MRVGVASDHGGFALKEVMVQGLRRAEFEVLDFGAKSLIPGDDYPDYVIPMARAVARKEAARGVAICGSGVGACVAANKVPGVRAALISDIFSARQGVEDDDMNIICLGGWLLDEKVAWQLIHTFLSARFSDAPRHRRRLAKVAALEHPEPVSHEPSSA